MKHRAPQRSRPASGPARQVRIIGGLWKRTPLPVLDAEGLRPTPDRVRETLFNWLNHLLDGEWENLHCLDLFAGTGALGFEAASRGAASVTMVEHSPAAVRQLQANQARLKADRIDILRGEAAATARALHGRDRRYGLIFLDPPYHQDWLPRMLPLCAPLLSESGMVYAESEVLLDPAHGTAWLQGWEVLRSDRAGMVWYHLLRRNSTAQNQA